MVPNSFNDMFLFNAAVMGLSNNDWMNLILDQLDAIALNVANPYRLQEECHLLSILLIGERSKTKRFEDKPSNAWKKLR